MTASASNTLLIGKLDAARRQLDTAITLWFDDGDPVAIHTLACAAYEIIHALSKKRNPARRELLFDTTKIKVKDHAQLNIMLKHPANFFKHANNDGDSVIEFNPMLSEFFLMFSILGIRECGEKGSNIQMAWMWWFHIQKPHLLTDLGRKFLTDSVPIDTIEAARQMSKGEFFQDFLTACRMTPSR